MGIVGNAGDVVVARFKDVAQGRGVMDVLGCGEVESVVVEINIAVGVLVLAPVARKGVRGSSWP